MKEPIFLGSTFLHVIGLAKKFLSPMAHLRYEGVAPECGKIIDFNKDWNHDFNQKKMGRDVRP